MKRRSFLALVGLGTASAAASQRLHAAQSGTAMDKIAQLQKEWKSLLAAGAEVELSREPIKRGDAEW